MRHYVAMPPCYNGEVEVPVAEMLPKEVPEILEKRAQDWVAQNHPGWRLFAEVHTSAERVFVDPSRPVLNRTPRPRGENGETYSHQNK